MKNLNVDYTMSLDFSEPVTDHAFLLRCVPIARGCQTVLSRTLEVEPPVPLITYHDVFGNMVYRGQCHAPHPHFSFHANAAVQVHGEDGTREPCRPFYRYATPLTSCSKEMELFLRGILECCPPPAGGSLLNAGKENLLRFITGLNGAVHEHIAYTSGATNVRTSAAEAFAEKKGVCQDYAHVFIALCRKAGIPARYVAGMSKGEGATHAWAEYFVPDDASEFGKGRAVQGKWFGMDPTRNKRTDDDYVILAAGRDFSDCQVDRGVFCGSVSQTQKVLVKTSELPPPAEIGSFTGHSVSSGTDIAGQQQEP